MIKLKSLLVEEFERSSALFNNPAYDNTTWAELLQKFKAEGGEVLGQGSYAIVLSHPSWKYVLKIFSDDQFYLSFIRFAMKNQRSSFPKVFDKPRRIIPHFKRTKEMQYLYVVPIEKLEEITEKEWKDLEFYLHYGPSDSETFKVYTSYVWQETLKKVEECERKYPSIEKFREDYKFFEAEGPKGTLDLTQRNFMKRTNGEFVISDPLWEGETPYQTHDRLMKMEMDYYGDEEQKEPDYIKGGKKWKKPKPVKPTKKVSEPLEPDEVPFE